MEKATCIFILTARGKESCLENIVYIYFKEVYDKAPEKIYFYDKYGKKGNACKLFKINDIVYSQWFAITTVKEAKEMLRNMIETQKFKVDEIDKEFWWKGDNQLKVDFINDGITKYKTKKYVYKSNSFLESVFFDSFKQNFTNQFDKNKNEFSYKIFPFGFIANENLNDDLTNNVFAMYSKLYIANALHGNRLSKVDPKEFIGFIQDLPISRKDAKIYIYDHEGNNSTSEINPATGVWICKHPQPLLDFNMKIIDTNTNSVIVNDRVSLISTVDLNLSVNNKCLKDLYGEVLFFKDSKIKFADKNNIFEINKMFYRENFTALTDEEYDKVISNWLSKVLVSCLPHIVIFDPYLLGDIVSKNTEIHLSRNQKIFFNALIHLLTIYDIEKFTIICMKQRVKSFWNNYNCMPENYEDVFEQLFKINKFNVEIVVYERIFHDRFILSQLNNTQVIALNTSINGLVTEDETCFTSLKNKDAEQKHSRIIKILSESTIKIELKNDIST